MTFDAIAGGTKVFLDANVLVYHFSGNPQYGAARTRLIERIEHQEIQGYTTSHCMTDAAHRLMTIEAMNLLGWPVAGLAARLRKHRSEIPKLNLYQQALNKLSPLGIQVLSISEDLVLQATQLSQQYELLSGDALIISAMRHHGLSQLASHDADFDRVPGVARYGPV